MTGAYLRIKRDEKWVNIEVEYLSDEEREMLKDDQRLLQWLNLVCKTLAEFEARIDEGYRT